MMLQTMTLRMTRPFGWGLRSCVVRQPLVRIHRLVPRFFERSSELGREPEPGVNRGIEEGRDPADLAGTESQDVDRAQSVGAVQLLVAGEAGLTVQIEP